jgi:Flp pilus assembly pilin Flp
VIPAQALVLRAIRRFRRDEDGATVVEFALIALPFFSLLFAIIETALIFLVGQALETATDNSARLIRTGQAGAFDADAFRESICSQIEVLSGCREQLILDVRTAADFGSTDQSTPVVDGQLQIKKPEHFDGGGGGDIVVVRAFYEWPAIAQFFGASPLANGNHLLVATAAFRNEPF